MGGDDNFVKAFGCMPVGAYFDVVGVAGNRLHGSIELYAVGERAGQHFDIAVRTALDYAPARSVLALEETVVVEEADKAACRELVHPGRVGGPYGGAHRDDVVAHEFVAIAVVCQIGAEGGAAVMAFEHLAGFAVETKDIAQHAVERGAQQVAPLREKVIEGGTVVFEARFGRLHAETHIARLADDAELFE